MRKIVYFDFIAFSVLCLFRMYFVVVSSRRDKGMREKKNLFFIQPSIFLREKNDLKLLQCSLLLESHCSKLKKKIEIENCWSLFFLCLLSK